ncbi:MAG TPA: hypothetical protein VKF42_10580 [Chitinivibrionales bacterium]|jgi:hypothetical protein|nr:hypothetical protein [Chitinivibrionales bacterium]
MEKTLEIINRMQEAGVFSRYAIGGGIAALFYIEPLTTFDLDVFIILAQHTGPLVSLRPLYAWLEKRGYKQHKEQIIIEGIPVQFIPAYNKLVEEAVHHASARMYGTTPTFVFSPEHLAAIMIQTFRQKDKDRLVKLLDESKISKKKLDAILLRHELKAAFEEFRRTYYGKES